MIELPMQEIEAICRRYQVRELTAFGSVVRGGLRPDSDVDLLVEFEPQARVGLMTFSRIQRELSEAIGRRVDLVSKGGLKPLVRDDVLRTSRSIYYAS